MRNKKPPFEITTEILDQVAEIAELVGHVAATQGLSANPTLRRTNRIRTIYSSLAIEQNSLSLEQVTALLNGKRVLGPPKDLAEVKNAFEIYEMLDTLDPYSVDALLDAHGIMTRGLVNESGCFRSGPVGVVDKHGNILHFGTLPAYVPSLVMELLDWVRDSDFHMLIKSCVFHYELELIHPFADGNGRIGRLWMLLSLLESIVESGQKVLVFTQFREMGDMLSQMIEQRLGESPLFLHGGCSIKQRQEMVDRFQNNPRTDRIFLLSLKAAGTGLNLTAASHVIHYDLWWNPAVEAQATDRAYRIGQHQNVLVHRFITQNTFEERIDKMIQDKRHLADLTVATGESWIGKLSNKELRELFG